MRERISNIRRAATNTAGRIYKRVTGFVDARPLTSFFGLLGILLVLIIISNLLQKPAVEAKRDTKAQKPVRVYHIGTAPRVSLQGQVEKSGVVQITALSGGIIQDINVVEGQRVYAGTNLIWMTSNYQGGNIFSLQRELAQRQYQNVQETYDIQKDIIAKQRDAASKNESNADELRKITDASIADTKAVISLNENIISSIDTNISNLEASNTSGSNDQAILGAKQMKSQFLGALTQLRTGLRSAEYQVDTDNPPTKLALLQRDIALRQLDLQEKGLELSREVSRIQLQIAQNSEALMHPVAPFAGTVQRIHVREGQSVGPGTMLVTIAGDGGELSAVAYVPKNIIEKLSKAEQSTLYFEDGSQISAIPSFISTEATQGTLYSVKYVIPADHKTKVTDKGYIRLEIPVGYADTSAAVPFVPLESVYQSRDSAYIFVDNNGTAKSKQVQLGPVYGEYVQVESGLGSGDTVIVSRNVVNGDNIKESK